MKENKEETRREWTGRDAIRHLAGMYQQLYLRPGPEAAQEYSRILRYGEDAYVRDLSHFICDGRDQLFTEETPAGIVQILHLHNRQDFELFLQIIAHKCTPVKIPPTQGASILDGIINWSRIHRHREEFMARELAAGNPSPDWSAEFRLFTADKSNYKDVLIVLSDGPYSNIPAEKAGLSEAEWLERSYVIRKTHECTHFVCRRLFRDIIDAIWDELVADAVGILAAFGRFDPQMEELFLGITGSVYTGGRLENYCEGDQVKDLAAAVHETLLSFIPVFSAFPDTSPLELSVILEERKKELWDRYFRE